MSYFVVDPANPRMRLVVDRMNSELERWTSVDACIVTFDFPKKSREQENKYHAIIDEIAEKELLRGKKLCPESWKRLLIDAFKHDTINDPDFAKDWEKFGRIELLPALNHDGFVMVGNQSRKFTKKLANAFITWLESFQDGVK